MSQQNGPNPIKPEAGCTIHVKGGLELSPGWVDDHETWEILGVREEQRAQDAAPRPYLKLKSINHWDSLRFVTVAFNPVSMRVFPPADAGVQPQAVFPHPGSQLRIEDDGTGGFAPFRSGLWQVDKSRHEERADGSGTDLILSLSSLDKKHPSFMNVAFNENSMKPVLPPHIAAELAEAAKTMTVLRDVNILKPAHIKKRNAAP